MPGEWYLVKDLTNLWDRLLLLSALLFANFMLVLFRDIVFSLQVA